MFAMASAIGADDRLTVTELDAIPEDGLRRELVEGQIVVSPAPLWPHQEVTGTLYRRLCDGCPEDLVVIQAPFDVRPDPVTSLQPDLLVARYADVTSGRLVAAPLLVVEVASPSTRSYDRTVKSTAYARLGVGSYWLIEPSRENPSVTALRLVDGRYAEQSRAVGAEQFRTAEPFPFTLAVSELVRRLPSGEVSSAR